MCFLQVNWSAENFAKGNINTFYEAEVVKISINCVACSISRVAETRERAVVREVEFMN